MTKIILGAIVAAATIAGAAQAATISYSSSGLNSFYLAPGTAAQRQDDLQFKGFVPGVDGIPLDAVLDSVQLSFSGTFDGVFRASGTGTASGTAGWARSFLFGEDANGVSFPNLNGFQSGNQTYVTGDPFAVALPTDYNCNATTLTNTSPTNAYCNEFSGSITGFGGFAPGTSFYDNIALITFNFASQADDTTTSSVDRSIQNYSVLIDANVIYTYTSASSEVPLPAALPLLGGGLALMGFVARRRNKNA